MSPATQLLAALLATTPPTLTPATAPTPVASPVALAPTPTSAPVIPADRRADAHPLLPVLCAAMADALAAQAKLPAEEPRAYHITYRAVDARTQGVAASFGSLSQDSSGREYTAAVEMRVGSRVFDDARHVARDPRERLRLAGASAIVAVPLDADPAVTRRVLSDVTDSRYLRAAADLGAARAAQAVTSTPQDDSPDLSAEKPATAIFPVRPLVFDIAPWRDRLRGLTGKFASEPILLDGSAWIHSRDVVNLHVNSEGTVLQLSGRTIFVGMHVAARTDDGQDLALSRDWYASTPEELPDDSELARVAASLAERIEALRQAPSAEPYVGPMLLSGRAAGVLFHEVLGHPIEGHRQRDEDQGQTYRSKVGELILPAFLSIHFDPTVSSLGATPLAGTYAYDDEGVAARTVVAVEDGVLRSFLMSRRPVRGFAQSNGHGRASIGQLPVARQSSLFVTAKDGSDDEALRARLIAIARARGLSYGLSVLAVERGATRTGRGEPNAFNVVPVEVLKIYVDGRPDELIRGAELVGTPLAALGKIVAAGRTTSTFNGTCGAESGWLPVSASSPALLFEEIEVQRAAKSSEQPPILPAPLPSPVSPPARSNP